MHRIKFLFSVLTISVITAILSPIFPAQAYNYTWGYGMDTRYPTIKNYSSYSSHVSLSAYYWYSSSDVKPTMCSSCSYKVSVSNSYSLPTGVAGQATVYNNGKYITFASVLVNNNAGYFPNFSTFERFNVLGHELGHAWGMAHSQYTWALMWETMDSYYKYGVYWPTSNDIGGVNKIY